MGSFTGIEQEPACTCAQQPPLKTDRPLDAVVYSEAHGLVMIHYLIGSVDRWPDLECEFEGGSGSGVRVWRGRIEGFSRYWVEHEAWLSGEDRPITAEEWEALLNDEHPFEDPDEFYEEVEPCPKHGPLQPISVR